MTLPERLGYDFREPGLLREALTHRSFGVPHNERLEFVGDAVLNCVVALALQVPHVFSQWHLLFLECLNLAAQMPGLARFVDACTDGGGDCRSDNCFLQRSHGNGFGCGDGG